MELLKSLLKFDRKTYFFNKTVNNWGFPDPVT